MKFIIIGAGNVGISLAERLNSTQHDIILIEKNEDRLGDIPAYLDLQTVHGNGCSPEILQKAKLAEADYLIAVSENDEVNIAACLVAKLMAPKVKRIARLRNLNLNSCGITKDQLNEYCDLVINPEQAGADYLFQLFQYPGTKDVVEFGEGKLRVVGFHVTEASPYANQKISSLRELKGELQTLMLAILRDDQLIVPRGADRVRPGDIIYVVVRPEEMRDLFKFANKGAHQPTTAMIWGGSALARFLAHKLEDSGVSVKLILEYCGDNLEIVDEFEKLLVLDGVGTDQNLLMEENIQEMDAFIAASPAQEDNILAALLAKKLGAKTSMALIGNANYLPLVNAIGVDAVVSTQMAAAATIFKFIHAGFVISEFSLKQKAASFLELRVPSDFPYKNIPIKEIHLPYGALVVALIRGNQVIVPTGSDSIHVDDLAIFFCVKASQKKFEKLMHVEFDY